MTRTEALRTLAVKVDAGEWPVDAWSHLRIVYPTQWNKIELNARKAFDGSLDAAKALHEEVLPGWDYCIDSEDDGVAVFSDGINGVVAHNDNPARAWLLAIINALIADDRSDALQDLADADRDLI